MDREIPRLSVDCLEVLIHIRDCLKKPRTTTTNAERMGLLFGGWLNDTDLDVTVSVIAGWYAYWASDVEHSFFYSHFRSGRLQTHLSGER